MSEIRHIPRVTAFEHRRKRLWPNRLLAAIQVANFESRGGYETAESPSSQTMCVEVWA